MIHDNITHRQEFVDWLKKNNIYNPMMCAADMRFGHTVYWTMREEQEKKDGIST